MWDFLCIVNLGQDAAYTRPDGTVLMMREVDHCWLMLLLSHLCLNLSAYNEEINISNTVLMA